MGEKEVKIVPPEGYEIDNKNSTFECIKFKKKEEKLLNSIPPGTYYYVGSLSNIIRSERQKPILLDKNEDYNLVSHRKYAASMLAFCRLTLLIEKDPHYGGPITDEEWCDGCINKYVIVRQYRLIVSETRHLVFAPLAFHTEKQKDLFLRENFELIRQYFMIP